MTGEQGGLPGRIAVIGDIHGNDPALDAALRAARNIGYDRLVLLGDLLTYGADTRAVVARVGELCAREPDTVLLRGNHDALYLSEGPRYDEHAMPAWIRESVAHTRASLDADAFDRLPFRDEARFGDVLFAHANPYGPDDWSYLNSEQEHARASDVLRERGFTVGVFGHTHRARVHSARGIERPDPAASIRGGRSPDSTLILNAGSIGQPRDRPRDTWVLLLEPAAGATLARWTPFTYDVEAHVRALHEAPLSPDTRSRLIGFHEDP